MVLDSLNQSVLGSFFVRAYPFLIARSVLMRLVVRIEGGELYSQTLRTILARHHGVHLGAYSYGSLAVPGMADRGTIIETYVSIGPNVRRFGAAHPIDSLSLHPFWYNPALGFVDTSHDVERTECTIGADSWIGANVTILPGCRRIGIGAVVGAGSIVTTDVADFAIVVGSPAREVRSRLSAEQREILLRERPWLLDPQRAKAVLDAVYSRTSHPHG